MESENCVLLTGACGPLGCKIAKTLSQQGFSVVGVDVREPAGTEPLIDFFQIDLGDSYILPKKIRQITRRHVISHLVNNAALTPEKAGALYAGDFHSQDVESFDTAMKINLMAPFLLTRELVNSQPGVLRGIVNVGSTYGMVGPNLWIYGDTGMGNSAAYAATKGGLIQLTRYLATVLAPSIRVNVVSPGGILRNQPSEFVERYSSLTPLGRMASEQDVSTVIAWLLGDGAGYVTGQNIAVDGGWTSW